MKDISQSLSDAEREVARLTEQSEQEKAMAAVLPVQFARNIAVFAKSMPEIAEKFKNYKPTREFRFFCNENGIANLLWVEENKAIYGNDPFSDCKKQIEHVISEAKIHKFNFSIENNGYNQIHIEYLNKLVEIYRRGEKVLEIQDMIGKSVPLCLMFGIGLGYQLGYLYECCLPKTLFIFEPDSDLFFASLYCFDWASLLEFIAEKKLGIHLFIGQDEDNLMEDMLVAIGKRGAFLAANFFAFWHYPSVQIYKLMERVAKEIYLLSTGWGFFDDNMFALAHSAKNISKKIPFLLKEKSVPKSMSTLPVFVIGNGPSLDNCISIIRNHQDKAIIVSCGTSISALHKAGIKPDIYMTVERVKIAADFVGLVNDPNYLKDILFLSTDVTHPSIHQYFNRSGLAFKPNEPMFPLCLANIQDTKRFVDLKSVNPLVGNIGLSFPITLGFKNLYLFGLDNGYKDESHHHSKHSAYYDKEGNPIESLSKMVVANSGLRLPGNFGGEIIANRIFATSVKVMDNLLKYHSDVECHNCSDGVLIENSIPLHIDKLKLTNVIKSKKEIIDYIYNNMFEPFQADFSLLKKALAPELYCGIIDKLIMHWREPLETRSDVIERMQQQFEYITSLAHTPFHHIYRVLVGTMNYVFSIVSTMAYRFADEEETLNIVGNGVDVIIEYFEHTKKIYPNAFNYIDMTEDEALGFFRKN